MTDTETQELREFVNDENNFKNILSLFDSEDGRSYLDLILPLMEPEKIAFLLSKDDRIVDKVYGLSQHDGAIADVVKTIYDAGTNQALTNKLDGNRLLSDLGFEDYEDFWFASGATAEDLADLCSAKEKDIEGFDVWDETKRRNFIDRLIKNLHWDVPAENAAALFVSFVYAVLKCNDPLDERWPRIYNYLAFQLKRHEIKVSNLGASFSEISQRLPGAKSIEYGKLFAAPKLDFKDAVEKMTAKEEKRASQVSSSGMSGFICVTGGSFIGSYGTSIGGATISFGGSSYIYPTLVHGSSNVTSSTATTDVSAGSLLSVGGTQGRVTSITTNASSSGPITATIEVIL